MSHIGSFYLHQIQGRRSAEIYGSLLCTSTLLNRLLADYLKPFGLSLVKFNALMVLKHAAVGNEGLTQNDLSRYMVVNPSNTTRLIDRMMKDGLVERLVSDQDRRVRRISVTDKGKALLDQVWHGYGEVIQQAVYGLGKDDSAALADILKRWTIQLEQKVADLEDTEGESL